MGVVPLKGIGARGQERRFAVQQGTGWTLEDLETGVEEAKF